MYNSAEPETAANYGSDCSLPICLVASMPFIHRPSVHGSIEFPWIRSHLQGPPSTSGVWSQTFIYTYPSFPVSIRPIVVYCQYTKHTNNYLRLTILYARLDSHAGKPKRPLDIIKASRMLPMQYATIELYFNIRYTGLQARHTSRVVVAGGSGELRVMGIFNPIVIIYWIIASSHTSIIGH